MLGIFTVLKSYPGRVLNPDHYPLLPTGHVMTSYAGNTLSQRNQLFPEDRNASSRSPTPLARAQQAYNPSSNRFNSRVLDSLEGQNDEMIEGLSARVRILKDVTVKIGEEIRDSSNFMDTMNENFANTRVYLGGTVRRMQRMAERQGVGWFAFMMFLCLVFLIFLWVWLF
jgi:blocked-early-in-transport protein 1